MIAFYLTYIYSLKLVESLESMLGGVGGGWVVGGGDTIPL